MGFLDSSVSKESTCKSGGADLIPGPERSAGEGIGYLLQYSWTSPVAQLVKSRMRPSQSKVLRYGRPGFNPWIGKFPWGEGKGYLLQYSGLEKFMDYSP